jgi:hypothetical protein
MIKSSPLRTSILVLSVFVLFGYNHNDKEVKQLKSQVENLNSELEKYKPGFGEIMMDIQTHHAKLWYAGSKENWKLAEFQIHEIEEAIEDIEKFHGSRPEAQMITILESAAVDIHSAIEKKNSKEFKSSFLNLTNNCNGCHRANSVGFNVIKVPDNLTFNKQSFEPATRNR